MLLADLYSHNHVSNKYGVTCVKHTNNTRVQHTRLRVQRINGGIDTEFSNTTRQHGGSVQVREGCSGSGIRQIIGGNVDSLYGGDGALLGGGDTLLPAVI